jgi:hypothetical protein
MPAESEKKMEFSGLTRLASAHVEARIVQTAVELGVFDAIGLGVAPNVSIVKASQTTIANTQIGGQP